MRPLNLLALAAALLATSAMAQTPEPANAPPDVPAAAPAPAVSPEAALIERGRYLAVASDCIACHTAPRGKPMAGGLAIASPVGEIIATNITPSKSHGIGNYSEAQFAAALRRGVRADGANLYPAMPYTGL